jgi:hypothetical protein
MAAKVAPEIFLVNLCILDVLGLKLLEEMPDRVDFGLEIDELRLVQPYLNHIHVVSLSSLPCASAGAVSGSESS